MSTLNIIYTILEKNLINIEKIDEKTSILHILNENFDDDLIEEKFVDILDDIEETFDCEFDDLSRMTEMSLIDLVTTL